MKELKVEKLFACTGRRRSASAWVIYAVVAAAAYFGSLSFAFPGEFHPLVPFRPDLYYPVGLLSKPLTTVLFYPRPVAYLFQRTSGWLGVSGSIAATIVLVLISTLLVAYAVTRITSRRPGTLAFGAFALLLFTHPQFYFHHRFDVPSVVAGVILCLAVVFANDWLARPRRGNLAGACLCIGAMALAKETYDVSALVLLLGLCALHWSAGERKRIALFLLAACAIEAAAEAFNLIRFRHYAGAISSSSAYAVALNVKTIAATHFQYLRDALPPAPVAVLLLSLLLLAFAFRKCPRNLTMPLAFLVAGAAALLPNAVLPNHYESQYAWNAAPLLFAAVLFLPRNRRWLLGAHVLVLLCVLCSVRLNGPLYATDSQRWMLNEEHSNARIARALPAIRNGVRNSHRALVTGLSASYHPWEYCEFIEEYFGSDVAWTVAVPHGGVETKTGTVTLQFPSRVRCEDYDAAIQFRADGSLQRILAGPEYLQAVKDNAGAVLVPSVAGLLEELAARPADFLTLLKVGTETLNWGLPEQAISYLRRAAEADPKNPYPWFFMGKAFEETKDVEAARKSYERAVLLEPPGGNPLFGQSLRALPAPAQPTAGQAWGAHPKPPDFLRPVQ